MSSPIREAFRTAAAREPGLGDAFGRFVHRRRRARGLRLVTGLAVGAIASVGFVRVFPGVDGGVPQQGPLIGTEVQPGLGAIREHHAAVPGVTVQFPVRWRLQNNDRATGFRLVSGAIGEWDAPASVEVRIGPSCLSRDCFWPDATETPRVFPEQGGVSVQATTIAVGDVRANAVLMRYPTAPTGQMRWPSCSGCVLVRFDTPGGLAVPVHIAAPDEGSLRRAERDLAFILSSLSFDAFAN